MIKQLDPYILYKINYIDFISLMSCVITFENNYDNSLKLIGARILFFNDINDKFKKPLYPWTEK